MTKESSIASASYLEPLNLETKFSPQQLHLQSQSSLQSSSESSYNSLASTESGSSNTTLRSPLLKTPLKKRLKCHENLGRGHCCFILHTKYCEQHSLGGRTVDSVSSDLTEEYSLVLPDTASICSNLTANTGSSTLPSRHFNMVKPVKVKGTAKTSKTNAGLKSSQKKAPKPKKPAAKNMRVTLSPSGNKRKAKVSPTQQSEDESPSGSDDDSSDEEALYEDKRKRAKNQVMSDDEGECYMSANGANESEQDEDEYEEESNEEGDDVEDMRREIQESRREIAKLTQEVESRKLETAFAKGKREAW